MTAGVKGWPGWLLLAAVLAAVLAVGVTRTDGPRTNAQRVEAIAKTIKCPICRSESVADSQATASQNIRDEIARQVAAGQSDDQIRSYILSRFPDQGLALVPPKTGVDSLVWALPAAALVFAIGGLAIAFRRWRMATDTVPTEEDRALVARARAHED
jgi:cytochrome c-type biogenesis protein CcmH